MVGIVILIGLIIYWLISINSTLDQILDELKKLNGKK
jgi:uncharacterized membrane protein YdbT with pleckstrin-like domain